MLNMYFWDCRLSQETLPTLLKDVEMRVILIDKIDFPIPGEGNTANILLGYMSENEMQIRLGKALPIAS